MDQSNSGSSVSFITKVTKLIALERKICRDPSVCWFFGDEGGDKEEVEVITLDDDVDYHGNEDEAD